MGISLRIMSACCTIMAITGTAAIVIGVGLLIKQAIGEME